MLEDFLEVAISIAKNSGKILLDGLAELEKSIEFKGLGDIVTKMDKESEKLITSRLKEEFPDHDTLGEEFGVSDLSLKSDYCWAIDPLDGTANYAAKMPIFAVSIALLHKGAPLIGVVYDPTRDAAFYAIKGKGAYLDGKKLKVNDSREISSISLFGVSADLINLKPNYFKHLKKGRSLGSAAIHICYVACGIFDGCADINTKIWDVASAGLILEEAGGKITDHYGDPIFPFSFMVDPKKHSQHKVPFLATNGHVHQQAIKMIQ